ncbi:hypothetical protein V7S43_000320 [Phytophthora oleae]|uniref:AB hydrolase-1 domain-containing protein n=1 Tax=Phytophthora oleae TaxID=2107226 RepID=A0ABD3G994_9STRA
MQLYQFVALATLVSHTTAAINATTKISLNGWYPCSGYTFSDEGSAQGQNFECATFSAPLCYPGVCETPQYADPTVDVFVKRILATKGDPKTATNVWLFEGGPGYSSSGLESSMTTLLAELDGAANVCTLDQRGCGRSTFLDCVAAQATTTGSPYGKEIKPSEVAACAQSLENEYGDLDNSINYGIATNIIVSVSHHNYCDRFQIRATVLQMNHSL